MLAVKEVEAMKVKNFGLIAVGMVIGSVLCGPAANAVSEALNVQPSSQKFYVEGQAVQLQAYNINGYNYVRLGNLSPLVGFDLTYDGTSNSVYIGEKPLEPRNTVDIPSDGSRYVPQAGDMIRCDDGTRYTITDVSRYDTNVFASGPVGELPQATCDWSRFPTLELPKAEARRFKNESGDHLFLRNLYETRRMQYTIYNALGDEPAAWRGNTPLATVELTIPADLELYTQSFWPWNQSELIDLVHSRPNSRYCVEAWDYYLNGVFQYTRYSVVSL